MEPTIKCPDCGKPIKLTDAMAAPLLANARKDFDRELLAAKQTAVNEATESLRITIQQMTERMKTQTAKLEEAQRDQAAALKLKSEFEEKIREVDLTVQKRVNQEKAAIQQQATDAANEAVRLKLLEGSERESKLRQQLEDMQRRLEQGSQQAQGEILELEIENRLRSTFPQDLVAPVPKGEFGGDMLQTVMGTTADPAGIIIWELKRTKNWSDGWLPKLRADQRTARADVAIIVTYALPKGVEVFDQIDGVWVCSPAAFLSLCAAVRFGLMEIKSAKRAMDGMRTKSEQVYEYLIGPRFKQRVGAIIECFSTMQADLQAEQKAVQRIWSKRDESLRRVLSSTAGLYGDLQGIAGATLETLPGLSLEAIAG